MLQLLYIVADLCLLSMSENILVDLYRPRTTCSWWFVAIASSLDNPLWTPDWCNVSTEDCLDWMQLKQTISSKNYWVKMVFFKSLWAKDVRSHCPLLQRFSLQAAAWELTGIQQRLHHLIDRGGRGLFSLHWTIVQCFGVNTTSPTMQCSRAYKKRDF